MTDCTVDFRGCNGKAVHVTLLFDDDFGYRRRDLFPLSELVQLIEEAVGKKAQLRQLPAQPGDVPITYADISKAKRLLGYNPQVDIEEGIRRFVDWFRKQA